MGERHEKAFDGAVMKAVNADTTEEELRTIYLGSIASSLASIADSLEKMSDHMTADPFKKAFDEYRKAREEELHV